MSRVLKWPVPIDDQWHEIGPGPVALVAKLPVHHDYLPAGPETAAVWTIEDEDKFRIQDVFPEVPRRVRIARVYGTGHDVPAPPFDHLGSYVSGLLVWHVFATWRDAVEQGGAS